MKTLIKFLQNLFVLLLCTSCSKTSIIYNPHNTYNLVYKTQPKYLYSYYQMERFYLLKSNILSIESDAYYYHSTGRNGTERFVADSIFLNVEVNFQKILYNETLTDIDLSTSKNVFLQLNDESYLNDWNISHNINIDPEKVVSFIKNYDYFYFFVDYTYSSLTTSHRNKKVCFENVVPVFFKKYTLLPFRDGLFKLDELFKFYQEQSVLPYDYKLIVSGDTNSIKYSDLFWNNMSESSFVNSFSFLMNNPPESICERCTE